MHHGVGTVLHRTAVVLVTTASRMIPLRLGLGHWIEINDPCLDLLRIHRGCGLRWLAAGTHGNDEYDGRARLSGAGSLKCLLLTSNRVRHHRVIMVEFLANSLSRRYSSEQPPIWRSKRHVWTGSSIDSILELTAMTEYVNKGIEHRYRSLRV
jgi:hypothetical protein